MGVSTRDFTITTSVKLVTEDCSQCGVVFALPTDLRQRFLDDRSRWFYCPNGHAMHYLDKTEAEKQRERAERLERQLANRDETLRSERAAHTVTKGQLTKTKNRLASTEKRVANGVCPCCNRSFANLGRHMAGQHPGYVAGGS